MDLYRIIDTLIAERNRIDRIIRSLDGNARQGKERARPQSKNAAPAPGKRPGRKAMDVRARRDVSERMKRSWSQRRGEAADIVRADVENPVATQVRGAANRNQESN